MVKKLLLGILCLISGLAVHAQPYGNEWIHYDQPYYKIYIHEDGIYRIPFSTLVSAGIPATDQRKFQIFFRGQEQYIFISGIYDGTNNSAGYIEFYGKRNDGNPDTELYDSPSSQANTNYSLFSDSSVYFLTWNTSINNYRMLSENDANFSLYSPATHFNRIVRQDYTSDYLLGNALANIVVDPDYTAGEGWFDATFSLGSSISKNLVLLNKFASGPDAEVDIVVSGASNDLLRFPDHHLRIQFLNQIIDTTYDGYGTFRFHRHVNASEISDGTSGNNFVFTSQNNLGSNADYNAVSYIQVKYPHNPTLENAAAFKFSLPDAPGQSKAYLNLTGFNVAPGDSVRLYDLSNKKRIRPAYNGTHVEALVGNSGAEKECYLTSDAQIRMIKTLIPVGGNDAQFKNYKTLANNISANYYILTHSSLMQGATLYRDYRNLSNGSNHTSYSSLIIDVDDLWDQYGYGILKDPLAIRNFMHCAYNTFSTKPEFLFIIGKGYRAGHNGLYPSYRKSQNYFDLTLVPSFGNPPSDLLFTTGILDSLYQPAVATGRLAARNNDQVNKYLDKVMQYESAQQIPQEWMKNILHFGGGTSVDEQNTYRAYLNSYKEIIEDSLFGGWVRSFWKTSSDPIQSNPSDSLAFIINNGVTLMTFFGHAAGIGFDQGVDNPEEYNNSGKYPFLIANSCYAGDLFLDGPVSSEAFVLIENKGTIGFLASTGLGLPNAMHTYTYELYKNIGYDNYGMPVGKSIQKTIKSIQGPGVIMKENCLEMTLHGDPAIVLNSFEQPDYMINSANVYFDPPNVTTEIDTFYIHVISTNIARAVNDSFIVRVVRTLPEGNITKTYSAMVNATLFKDTISFKIPVDRINGIGLNKFDVRLDAMDHIDEFSETNNETQVFLLIKSSDIIPVYPYKYAVVPALPVTLKASTSDAFLSSHNYVFELDPTDAFNSAIKVHYTINHFGGVVSWTPSFPITTDSIVYYWRVSADSAEFGQYNWRESSFQYISGQHGWGQAHFFQFKNDDYQYVAYNKPGRKFEFVNNKLSLVCQTGVYPNIPWNEEWYTLNGNNEYIWANMATSGNGMIVAVLDPISGQPWPGPVVPDQAAFEFSTANTTSMTALETFINNIPAGDYVLAYSHRNHNAQNWTEGLYKQFESIGSATVRSIVNNTPYIIFGRKGDPIGTANEVSGVSSTSIIHLEDSITTKWTDGYIQSELIGPASHWGSLHWRQNNLEGANTDSIRLSVIGYNSVGTADTLISGLPPDSADINNLASRIDAGLYPYLKLIAFMKDDSMHTPAQMKHWQVLYEGVPETALNPSQFYYFFDDTVSEGQSIRFASATENISIYDMDSLLIKYWIVDNSRNIHLLGSFRHRDHPAGDILIDSINTSTTGLAGLNSLWIEVNPDNDQPEQYHFNNIGEIYFYVNRDRTNPILDVTFDGEHILDGDIVSAKPEIQIMLKDENRFLLLNTIADTSNFKVWIVPPGTSIPQRIWFYSGGQEVLQFLPASLPENRARILYHPFYTEDGTYQLLIQAKDKSNNESGKNDYKISFEVINRSTITSVMNWPNPFSTATHFVFTLTGSEVPTFFMIQIMTITGKVVREISLDELGTIHIGRNITDYSWDGTDNYGDRLANGVYLYRVITRIGDINIEKSATQADQYFTKDFGKMYLIR
jgi:hypothetical protein